MERESIQVSVTNDLQHIRQCRSKDEWNGSALETTRTCQFGRGMFALCRRLIGRTRRRLGALPVAGIAVGIGRFVAIFDASHIHSYQHIAPLLFFFQKVNAQETHSSLNVKRDKQQMGNLRRQYVMGQGK
eukprot:scaffold516_cov175-Amphora_coffeaeformis.AAC.32